MQFFNFNCKKIVLLSSLQFCCLTIVVDCKNKKSISRMSKIIMTHVNYFKRKRIFRFFCNINKSISSCRRICQFHQIRQRIYRVTIRCHYHLEFLLYYSLNITFFYSLLTYAFNHDQKQKFQNQN